MKDKSDKIIDECLKSKGKNPIKIFNNISNMDFVAMHGPEHHVLDGAALLTAYYNAGGEIDLEASLKEMVKRGSQIPGAACGLWGVCGAVPSMGAALSIINGTGPLSEGSSWGQHMEFTSKALSRMSLVGGPRCCKRDAFISYETAIKHVNANYDVKLEHEPIKCSFSNRNEQCIEEKCPYYYKPKKKVAFICVHNSCRSQIAEALGKKYLSDICDCYSAGTETKPQINQDAVRLMKKVHGINMEKSQYSKLFEDIPEADIVVSMGCNVVCPYVPGKLNLNWGLEDPTGQSDEKFMEIIEMIEKNILELRETIIKMDN